MNRQLTVVIPTWNGRALLAECLDSLNAQTEHPHQIIVVDDGSTDATAEFLAASHPKVQTVRHRENRGFCAAVNTGIEAADAPWILLLNNDITFQHDCLQRLMTAVLEGTARLLTPLLLWRDEPNVIYSAGDRQRHNGRPEAIGFLRERASFPMPSRVFGVSAAVGLYHRSVFETVGGFDTRFNIYFSDSDLNFRARLAGFEARLVPEAIAYHVGSAHLAGTTWKRTRQCFINHALLVAKNMPWPLLLQYAPAIAAERVHQARRVFSSARNDRGALRAAYELAAAECDLLRAMPHALRQRGIIQRGRAIAIPDLARLLDKE